MRLAELWEVFVMGVVLVFYIAMPISQMSKNNSMQPIRILPPEALQAVSSAVALQVQILPILRLKIAGRFIIIHPLNIQIVKNNSIA